MKGFALAAALVVSTSSAFAQAPASAPVPPRPPMQQPPPPAPTAAPVAQALPPQLPFPAGAKVAFVNLQAIAQLTADGRAAAAKVNALAQKKQTEGVDKSKSLQANQQKLQTSGGVMSDVARAQLEKEIERQQVDGQRFEQDAQAELNELQEQLQKEFQAKLVPVLEAIAKEKGVQVLFSASDAGVIWLEQGIDLTVEAVKRMDTKAVAPK